ncbi:MAG TPA: PD-(D/E)XK nuclease family protein, partial [Candidatus Acetothermia bacterium]|nr:PD-(D/E)XK nuclease family protein [Candidatus Acetothermia bacterium]
GHAVHQAIRVFHLNQLSGRETPLRVLEAAFRKAWHAEGFLTRQHEELRLQQGLQALRAFHAAETVSPSRPSHVEKRFSVPMGDVRLIGVFDRIDQADGDAVIIDYKTSEVTSDEQALQQVKGSRQMALYALAFERLFSRLPAALELRFLTPDLFVGRTEPTRKRIEQAEEELRRAAEGIRRGLFPASPAYQACTYCAYAFLCPDRRSS